MRYDIVDVARRIVLCSVQNALRAQGIAEAYSRHWTRWIKVFEVSSSGERCIFDSKVQDRIRQNGRDI